LSASWSWCGSNLVRSLIRPAQPRRAALYMPIVGRGQAGRRTGAPFLRFGKRDGHFTSTFSAT
jgi:hypothetical protein